MTCPRCGSTQWLIRDPDPEYHACTYCGPVWIATQRPLPRLHQEPGHSGKGLKRKDLEGVEA